MGREGREINMIVKEYKWSAWPGLAWSDGNISTALVRSGVAHQTHQTHQTPSPALPRPVLRSPARPLEAQSSSVEHDSVAQWYSGTVAHTLQSSVGTSRPTTTYLRYN